MARHPELRPHVTHQGLGIVDEVAVVGIALIQRQINGRRRGREMGDNHVHFTGQAGDACGNALVLFEVREGIPARCQVEIRYPVVKQDGRMPPEVRAPLRAVDAQARYLDRVVIEIIKSLVIVREPAPKGVHRPPVGMVILVVAGHKYDRREAELPVDERHAVEPLAVHDVTGEDQQIPGFIGRELVQGIRQVPFPEFKMEIRCDLDFHGNTLHPRVRGPCRCSWPGLHLPLVLVPPGRVCLSTNSLNVMRFTGSSFGDGFGVAGVLWNCRWVAVRLVLR